MSNLTQNSDGVLLVWKVTVCSVVYAGSIIAWIHYCLIKLHSECLQNMFNPLLEELAPSEKKQKTSTEIVSPLSQVK